jgi:PAS domain S-box-containing protein
MTEGIDPAVLAGRQAVVGFPARVDGPDAARIGEQLLVALDGGAGVVIADLSATASCDHAGVDALVRAYQGALVRQAELRLVVSAPAVRQMVSAEGLDRLVAVYPSLEAAVAAGGANGPMAPGDLLLPARAPQWPARLRAGQSDGPGPARLDEAILRQLIDALDDGVALADDEGRMVLANRRLAEMFGYQPGELTGQFVETLVPAGLREAHREDRAAYAREPVRRPMADRARLVGARKDGATIPVTITLSPVPTASEHLVLAVVKDVTQARRRDDLASLVRAATAEQAQHSQELLERIVGSLFRAGLSMQTAAGQPADVAREHISEALQRLDETIHEIRDHVFRSQGHRSRHDDLVT